MDTAPRKPLIGMNCDNYTDPGGPITGLRRTYWESIERAGGIPIMIPHLTDRAALARILDLVDGFVLVGGDDISAAKLTALAGRTINPSPHSSAMPDVRETSDFILLDLLLERGSPHRKPTLGICLACQEVAALHGGEIAQHLPEELPGIEHIRAHRDAPAAHHALKIAGDSLLGKIWDGATAAEVNSSHHQGVKSVGPGARAVAWAPDGLIEALEVEGHPFFLTVQWHPERMPEDPMQRGLFEALVNAARGR